MKVFLRVLAYLFGWLVNTLPRDYQPAGRAFLYSIVNTKLDCEVPVPEEILGTVALAVLEAIYESYPFDYKVAKEVLNKHDKPVPVQNIHYPEYEGQTLLEYDDHPHYYVMGAFVATPLGGGLWLVEDRYDWHFPSRWRIPNKVAERIPKWILNMFAYYDVNGWYIEEVGTLDKWTTPYWHRSVIRLSNYLNPKQSS